MYKRIEDYICYTRLIRSAIARQILSNCDIHLDTCSLRTNILVNKSNHIGTSELNKWLNAAYPNKFVTTKYNSLKYTTHRMFVEKGQLNPITLSNPQILEAITSRYNDGKIYEIDWKCHEYTILKGLFPILKNYPDDIHTEVSNILKCSRSEAKQIDSLLLYGDDNEVVNWFNTSTYDEIGWLYDLIRPIRIEISEYIDSQFETYIKSGYVINLYGRKIYPKSKRNIFNNIVQSIGVELLVETIIKLHNLFGMTDGYNLLFHRFDALYFDLESDILINKIISTMENIDPRFNLKVNIKSGDNLREIKES